MTTLAEAFVTMRPELGQFKSELENKLGGVGDIFKKTLIGIGLGASIGAIVGGSIRSAMEREVSVGRLAQAIENVGGSMDLATAAGASLEKQLSGTLTGLSRMSAFSDGELRDALTTLVNMTGDLDTAMERLPVAMDFARGSGLDLATTSKLLGKVTDETTSALQRQGIRVAKGATAMDVLRLVQERFAGQSERFGRTASGSWKIFTNEVENLKEEIGIALLPLFTRFVKLATEGITFLRTNVLPQLTQAFKTLAAVVKPIFDLIGVGWKNIVAPVLKVVLDLFGSIGEIFDVLTGRRPEAGGVLRDLVGDDAAEGIQHAVAQVREALKEAFEFVKPLIQGVIDKVVELKEKFDALPSAIQKFAGGAVGVAIIGGPMVGIADTLINIIANTVATVFAFSKLGVVGKAVGKVLGGVFGVGQAAGVAQQLTLFPTGLAAAAAGFKALIVAAAPFALVAVAAVLVVEAILQVAETVVLVVKNWDKVMILWKRATDGAGAAIKGVFDSIGRAVGGFFDGLGTATRKALDFWVGLWQQFATSPARAIGFVVGFVVGGLVRIVNFVEDFRDKANAAFGGFVQGATSKVITFFTALPGQIGTALGNAAARIGQFTQDTATAWGTWLAGVGQAIGTFFTELPGRLGTWLGQALISFVQFKDQVGTAIGEVVGNVSRILTDFFTELPGKMFKFGIDMLLGFIGGAKSMFATVTTTVSEFFSGLVEGVKRGLDAHSPSGVFKNIGQDMMRGLAEGIDQTARLPEMALPQLTASMSPIRAAGPLGSAPITVNVGPLTLNYSGPESPAKVRQMGADTLDYITKGLSDQFNRLAAV